MSIFANVPTYMMMMMMMMMMMIYTCIDIKINIHPPLRIKSHYK